MKTGRGRQVLFLGACTRNGPLIILNEYLPGGNLTDFLAPAARPRSSFRVKTQVHAWSRRALLHAGSLLHAGRIAEAAPGRASRS